MQGVRIGQDQDQEDTASIECEVAIDDTIEKINILLAKVKLDELLFKIVGE